MADVVAPKLSATAVLFREGGAEGEVLLVQRSGRLDFHGGAWVFPGGRVDDAEHAAANGDALAAARAAAVRELLEETGLVVVPSALVPVSRWTTPVQSPKRFVTWFFLAPAGPHGEVRVDGQEIVDSRWVRPADALAEHGDGKLDIPPPTFVTLLALTCAPSLAGFHERCAGCEPDIFEPRVILDGTGFLSLYGGDAGFEDGKPDTPGPRHRLRSTDRGWHYERSGG